MARPWMLAMVLVAACSNGAKREAASLVSAVERYRRVENVQKPAEAKTISSVPCTDHEVCEVKEACVAVSDPTSKGLALKAEVERAMSDLEATRISADSDEARGLAPKLEQASHLLEQGRTALPGCDEKVLALRLKYGL